MPHLEPTYLRYIYDGLIKGSIHPENAAELPDGLIGMYEEAFDERTSVVERHRLLQRFAIWALLKKEVSAAFVAEVLEETEDDIQDFISTYSAWFNSPESGKYQLYHERLKVYLLQKMSEKEVHLLHNKLITHLERAVKEQKADEFEWYSLEFLGYHIEILSLGDNSKLIFKEKLVQYCRNKRFLKRQYEFSGHFDWNFKLLNSAKSICIIFSDSEALVELEFIFSEIYCAEQNSFMDLIKIIDKNDLTLYSKRILNYRGKTKEEIESFFYLVRILLNKIINNKSLDENSKSKFIKETIENFEQSLPIDQKYFDWRNLISINHMGDLIYNLKRVDLEAVFLHEKTDWQYENWKKKDEVSNNIKKVVKKESFHLVEDIHKVDQIHSTKKRLKARILVLNKLASFKMHNILKKEIEKATAEITELNYNIFKYSIKFSKINGASITFHSDLSEYYSQILWQWNYSPSFYSLEEIIQKLDFFKKLNKKSYKHHSLLLFRTVYFDIIEKSCHQDLLEHKLLLKNYLTDLINPITDLNKDNRIDDECKLAIICTYIRIGDSEKAYKLIPKLNFSLSASDYGDLKQNYFFKISILFLENNAENFAKKLLISVSSEDVKNVIRLAFVHYYLNRNILDEAVEYFMEISSKRNQQISELTEEITFEQLEVFLIKLLKSTHKEDHPFSIIKLIQKDDFTSVDIESILNVINNLYHRVYFLLEIYNKNKIDKNELILHISNLSNNIPTSQERVWFCLNTYNILISYDLNQHCKFLLDEIHLNRYDDFVNKKRGILTLKKVGIIFEIKNSLISSLEYSNCLDYKSKIKCFKLLFAMNFAQQGYTSTYFHFDTLVSFTLKLIRTIYFFLFFLQTFLIPGVFTKLKVNRKINNIRRKLKDKSIQNAIEELKKLDHENIRCNTNELLCLFNEIYTKSLENKMIVDYTEINMMYWEPDIKKNKEYLNKYLNLRWDFYKNVVYRENLKNIIRPYTLDKTSFIHSTFLFNNDKKTRYSIVYKYIVKSILENNQTIKLSNGMNFRLYNSIVLKQE